MSFELRLPDKKIAADKYQRILDAAVKVFSQKGFYNAKVSDVAKVADVADGTIYLYFKNKDDLLVSLFEHSMERFFQQASQHLSHITGPEDKLRQFIHLHLTTVQKNQELAQVMQIELRSSTKFMTEYRAEKFFEYLKLIEDIIIAGQNQGLFKKSLNPAIVRRAFFGAVDELALEWVLMKKKRYTVQEAADNLSQMILDGIKEIP